MEKEKSMRKPRKRPPGGKKTQKWGQKKKTKPPEDACEHQTDKIK
jgi:hypothetical protein